MKNFRAMPHKYIDAIIFDLDGVITKTAEVHSYAWKKMFDSYLKQRAEDENADFNEFIPSDYLTYIDGKPRYDGVKSFLESRNIKLPFGSPEDGTENVTVCGLGNRKNEAFNEVLRNEGVEVYPSTVKMMERLKQEGIRLGVASSSKNCESVLEAAGLSHLVETRVDGVVSAETGLSGKPAPDIFLTAAKNLGCDYSRSVVVEDAASGVAAGKNGNFGLVLGLARENNEEALYANGADVVVKDIEDFNFDAIVKWFEEGIEEDSWKLHYYGYDPHKEKSRETLLTVGNGFFGTRGAMEESNSGKFNYPGTYMAGLYNRLATPIAGREIWNEDFVNAPNWLALRFKIKDGPWIDFNEVKIENLKRSLNLKTGLLSRSMIVTDNEEKKTLVESERLASMHNPHLAAIKYSLTALNYSGMVRIASTLDGTIKNEGVDRYKSLNSRHLEPVEQGGEKNISYLRVKTNQSNIQIAEAAKLICDKEVQFENTSGEGIVSTSFDYDLVEGECIETQKIVSIFSLLETKSDVLVEAKKALTEVNDFDSLYSDSKLAWADLWKKVDIKIDGDRMSQRLIRLHTYHLLVSASPHNQKLNASITARGLHGEAYRGHIFWDELFILPFYNLHFPETARQILMYRYNRLEKAREYAREFGFEGAMFPWQSGSDGSEETQVVHLNPVSGEWGDDHSALQRHVSLAIAYNVWQYVNTTGDINFMKSYGAEIVFEIARFWASKSELDEKTGKYSIKQVMGPDEFHEGYPDAAQAGLTDNAYTNIMVAWLFGKIPEILDLTGSTNDLISESEIEHWSKIQHCLKLVVNPEGIISQYDGYFELQELDWDQYREKYKDVHRMDRLLKAEGLSADDYKVAKQADTLMAFFNLNKETIDKILDDMGYWLPSDYLEKNLDYYLKRTSHGSTLSRVVHAQLANLIGDDELSWNLYSEALASDYDDVGGTTSEGIHAGVMAGTLTIAISTYAGIDTRGELLVLNPQLPKHWKSIELNIDFRGVNFQFYMNHDLVVITPDQDATIKCNNETHYIAANKKTSIHL